MKIIGYLLVFLMALAIALVIAGQLGALSGAAPQKLGVTDGKLRPPSRTPNSVSSQADLYPDHPQKDYAGIAPLRYTGDASAAMEKLANLLDKSERTVIVTREPGYIYAQSSTALFKFTDDMEFWLDQPNKVIQVRSASRLGRKDFGVNRARMEALRTRFSG
ncbi:DUF1499 domain-containing protein [Rhodoferax sp.]|uniref:DUF1499 domain-containing protein n=1 Tax=Rhodoferax sp. TaxID=50421 RepID=UPI001ECD26FB|nr:DUF1499 domain-containing protein [Rhodoferax sp.]MBT9508459.1 DUF1499 domain-containing protein [Rhodoferax sp.]